ncbi:MAG: hypothetical protein EXR87_06165 [Gammaproteobacteria bacterium]|nr:hypothetical protein [Gammaproteobacteria bacterium]
MKGLCATLLVLVSITAAAKGAPQFDPAGDPVKQAATFLKATKLTALSGVRRVAISQFRVEFAVENSGKASSSSTAGFTSSRSEIKLVGINDEVRQAIADELYDQIRSQRERARLRSSNAGPNTRMKAKAGNNSG